MRNFKSEIKHFIKILLGREIFASTQMKISTKWYGNSSAGFHVYTELLNSNSIIYSFGVGEDISFDEELINEFNCSVFGFDPTPKSIQFIKNKTVPNKFHFFPFGIYSYNGNIKFYLPLNPNHVSCTITNIYGSDQIEDKIIEVPVRKFSSIVDEFGHKKIEILKLDIEGSEYDVLDDILGAQVEINQILIEFHHRFSTISINRTKEAIKKLNYFGYRIAAISNQFEEYTFIKVKSEE